MNSSKKRSNGESPKPRLSKRLGKAVKPLWVFCAVFLAISSAGCKPQKKNWEPSTKVPEDVLEREAMIALLVDIHLAEGDLLERSLPAEEQPALLVQHYGQILQQHGIRAEDLQRSYAWYVERPLTMNQLYEEVIERLNRLQAGSQAQPPTAGEVVAPQASE